MLWEIEVNKVRENLFNVTIREYSTDPTTGEIIYSGRAFTEPYNDLTKNYSELEGRLNARIQADDAKKSEEDDLKKRLEANITFGTAIRD